MEKIHPITEKVLHRDIKPYEFSYKGETIILNMPGWYPDDDSDAIFTREDMKVHDKALDILKARHEAKIHENNFDFNNVSFA